MSDTIPPPPPVPQMLPPAAPIVPAPTTAQVVSSAIQNIFACACVTLGWMQDKVGSEVALVGICLIAGIDFLGRRKLPGSAASVVAIGATGAMSLLSRWPHAAAGVLALLTALGMLGCGLDPDLPINTAKDVVNVVCVADAGVELPTKVSEALDLACVKARLAIDAYELGKISVDQLLTAMQEARRLYEAL